MAKLFKETIKPINLKLTSGTSIRLVPSIGDRDNIVFVYSSVDIDIAFHLKADITNYHMLANHIHLGRYSQAISYAANKRAYEYHQEIIAQTANLSLIA
ncbi:hypothetical protein [Psychrobacter sp. 72-O-c]|uniref:hypothetical protein n=1 Tax=Psychrobacter sp. 72-O-c TaxID=2774125 RepID=UPI00191B43AA|nr:hypothetical protein [Psychrobacter sp. 72-O-c]